MRFKAKAKDCRLIVKVKTSFGESIDEKQLDKFARIYLRGFLKAKQIKKNMVEYTGPVGISLYDRLQKPVGKRDFFFIMEQIVIAVQKLQMNKLPLHYLVMNNQFVYINEVTKELQFIYLPIPKAGENTEILDFIESVMYSVHPANEKDMEYVSRFVYFFRGLDTFDAEKIEAFIAREDRDVVNTIKKQNIGQSGFMTNKQQHYYDHYDMRSQNDYDNELTGLLGEEEDEETGLLEDGEETGLLAAETGLLEEINGGNAFSADTDADEGTMLLDESRSLHYPTLFRILTEETISVNKPVFRLGKEKSYVDYFVNNNIAVSRSHADIITRGNRYYIKDLNSKNHTYINDREVPVHYEVEINDGDRLKLGNEEFVFRV